MPTSLIILTAIIIAMSILGQVLGNRCLEEDAYNTVDTLFRQEWTGEKADELSAWYRVRRRVLSMTNRRKSDQQAFLDAVSNRIDQCRRHNTRWMTIHRSNNKLTIISTQN